LPFCKRQQLTFLFGLDQSRSHVRRMYCRLTGVVSMKLQKGKNTFQQDGI
jgi:hypothetical protein